ncbi:MAG: amidohydrolase, partial [Actinomycetota bacterium]|nr:amidohydrolase [Actinomycetota bacterium]
MRTAAIAIALLALLAVTAGWVAGGDQKGFTRAEIVNQLPHQLSGARMREDLRAFERIADRHGGNRAAGTAGYRASVDLVRSRLKRAGYRPRVVGFPFVEYRESVEKGIQIAPSRRELRVEALDYSPSTPKGGLR